MKKTDKQKLFEAFEKVCGVKLIKEDANQTLITNIGHMIRYSGYKDGELYATQNSNFQQNLTPDGKIIGQSEITDIPYCIGKDGELFCYNCGRYFEKYIIYADNSDFLNAFNKMHDTNYKKVSFSEYYI